MRLVLLTADKTEYIIATNVTAAQLKDRRTMEQFLGRAREIARKIGPGGDVSPARRKRLPSYGAPDSKAAP